MKLFVIPNDPYKNYIIKGEVKPRYFNPDTFFTKVYVLNYNLNKAKLFDELYIGDKTFLIDFKKLYPIYRPILFIRNILILRKFLIQNNIKVLRSYNSNLQGFYCFVLSKLTNIPYIISNHIDNDEFRKIFSKNFKYKIYNFISKNIYEKLSLKNAHKIINVTKYLNKYSKKYRGNLDNTKVIYNKVYSNQFSSKRKKFNIKNIRCIFVGKINDQKDPFLLIDVVRELKNLTLIIIGNGERFEELNKKILSNNLHKRVELIKSVPNKDIHHYYKKSDILLMSTNTEGFCIPILEGLASGLIVISNNIPPIKEIISDCGILVDKNMNSYLNALKKVMNDKKLVQKLQEKSLRRARHLDGNVFETVESNLYKSVM